MRRRRKSLQGLKVPIANATYELVFDKELGDRTGHAGEAHIFDWKLLVDSSLPPREIFRVFMHEARHAHHGETGMDDVLSPQAMEMDCQSTASLVWGLMPILIELYKSVPASQRDSSSLISRSKSSRIRR